ncbi:MAG TPA: NAD(P)H-hydrate dehydratase [Chitinophagaceae bacterium]|nr:NAD(P)H-hydrate dehydratase [Chitinophagaceae bacterium]
MKVLSAEEIRQWDQYTIAQEPVSSIDLMERAALACVTWLTENILPRSRYSIFCGKGNNGGDGLAIARLLAEQNRQLAVYILEFGHKGTPDFQTNLARLHQYTNVEISFIQSEKNFRSLFPDEIIIDALFGSGLNRQLEGVTASLVGHLNASQCKIISIDIPSGMFVDRSSKGNVIVKADYTLTFQCLKPAFLVAENAEYMGKLHILDIGLQEAFLQSIINAYEWIDLTVIHSIRKPRKRFAHKGNFGHGLIVAGSYGKIGAAVLSVKACLRSGIGLLTCHIPKCGYDIMQTSVPEAMVMTDFNSSFATKVEDDLTKYEAIGIGPGIGMASETKMMLREVFDSYRHPLVLDADALNILATQKNLLKLVPAGSILTPHPKEFERLFGESANDFDRIDTALKKAKELNLIIVLKGHHTFIATPDKKGFFNSTGNAGMATGGSGDVLTGILTGLLAQGYSSVEAAILGVYLHGLAGDIAAERLSMEAMVAGDIVETLGQAFLQIQ